MIKIFFRRNNEVLNVKILYFVLHRQEKKKKGFNKTVKLGKYFFNTM